MRNLGTEVLASVIVVVVLSEEVPSPEEVVEFARRENAVFKRSDKKQGSEYVMLKRAHEAEPAKWGVIFEIAFVWCTMSSKYAAVILGFVYSGDLWGNYCLQFYN
jgi:hypothetical protein